jgi:class 3 adenylate cyclase
MFSPSADVFPFGLELTAMVARGDNHSAINLTRDELDPIEKFGKRHSTAVLVIVFTDLKGSTEIAEKLGEVPAQNHRLTHNGILREIIERKDAGRVVKTIGDAFMCVFAEPATAVERAVEIQQRLAQHNAEHPNDHPIQVRIGMHMGQVMVENADVFGRHVNRAARVESIAHPGQILLTHPVYDSAHGWLKERGYVWTDHGDYALKGISDPTRIYQVGPPGSTPGPRPRSPHSKYRPILIVAGLLLILLLTGLSIHFDAWDWLRERGLAVEKGHEIPAPTQGVALPSGANETSPESVKTTHK